MKLLYIVKNIDGGTGTYLKTIEKLADLVQGSEIKLLVLEKPLYSKRKYKNKIIYKHEKAKYPIFYTLSFELIKSFISEIIWLRKEIRQYKPDIILSVDVHCNLLSLFSMVSFASKAKIILTSHINVSQNLLHRTIYPLNNVLKFFINKLYSRADAVISVSKDVSNDLIENFHISPAKVMTIYNGLPLQQKRFSKKLSESKKIILRIGRLVEQKDDQTLLESFRLLAKDMKNIELWIVGDGPMRKKLQLIVQKNNLIDKVRFYGWQEDIKGYLKNSDIFVMASKREGFSYVILEAMSYGLPIVSTNSPSGPVEILDNGKYGILCNIGDALGIEKACLKILSNNNVYSSYSKKSINRSRYFTEDRMLSDYKKLFLQLLAK